jgi:hypothetical protein
MHQTQENRKPNITFKDLRLKYKKNFCKFIMLVRKGITCFVTQQKVARQ